jgi:hypothetical protein
MNRKAASLVALFALTIALLLQTSSAWAESALDFVLVNKTGYGIKGIYIGPSTSEEWGENLLKEGATLENNQTFTLKFSAKATAPKWDIKIEWVDGGDAVYWKGFKLADIHTITLKYDRASGETSAVEE